jgi:hypothetical protein
MSQPQLYVPAHKEELGVVDWFFIAGALLFVCWLLYRDNPAGAIGWLLATSNYYTARKRYNPRLH